MNKPALDGNQSSTDSVENKVQSEITKTQMSEDMSTEKDIEPEDRQNENISDNATINKPVPKDDLKRNQTISSNTKSPMKKLPKNSSTLEKKRPVKENSTFTAITSLETEEVESNLNNVAR